MSALQGLCGVRTRVDTPRLFAQLFSRPWALALALMLATFLARAATMGDPGYYVDETFYLLVGERMRAGAMLYVDIWDRKAPGLYLFYAGITAGGGGMLRVHLVAALFVWGTALLVARMALHLLGAGRWGLQGAVLAALVYIALTGPLGGGGGQSPVFYNLFVAFAAWRLMRADALLVRAAIPRGVVLAMLSLGLAVTFKQSAGAEAMFFGGWTAWRMWLGRTSAPRWAGQVTLLAACAALPLLCCAGWYAAAGHFDAFWTAVVGSNLRRGYAFIRATGMASHVIAALAIPIGFALVSLILFRDRLNSRPDWQLAYAWLAVAALAIALFPNKSEHYFLPLVAPLAVCGAPFLQRGIIGPLMGLWLLALLTINGEPAHWRLRTASRAQMQTLVQYLHREDPANRVFIASGTTWPYHALNVQLHSPLVFPMHLVDASERNVSQFNTRRELQRVLAANPAIVLTGPPELELAPDPELTGMVARYIAVHCRRDIRLPLTNMYGTFPVTVHSRCAPPAGQ
ncbi:hypothetical protein [Novosphingobium sp. Leaf2]|uniref:hypothetical protein n=1 Tax=Novosphingobium sp. Leaf2 TaxID=1735670 RepID=UPI0006F4B0ED|nr:hypothetical protein [Novosphingobium sp. Leaf2]KQM21772.1 hypothetical protein ASE49_00120 [Novosphingobium sp. Leaf2]